MRKIFNTALLCAVFAGQVAADEANDLKAQLTKYQSFSADFVQSVIDSEKKVLMTGEGNLAVTQPNKLYWHAITPDETLLVSNGDALYMHNVFLEQVTILDTQQAVSATPFALLADPNSEGWQDYTIAKDSGYFEIIPKDADASVKKLQVKFADDKISEFIIFDTTGQKSIFKLNDFIANPGLPGGKFNFTIPEDVDIDDQRN